MGAMKAKEFWAMRAAALAWLRYQRQCPLVMFERAPFHIPGPGNPDVCGVTSKRTVVEIEIKISMADFLANAFKRVMQQRADGHAYWYPAQFYILAPDGLAQRIAEAGEGFGVMKFRGAQYAHRMFTQRMIDIVRVAPTDPRATRLKPRDIVVAAKAQTGTLWTLVNGLARNENRKTLDGGCAVVKQAPRRKARRLETGLKATTN